MVPKKPEWFELAESNQPPAETPSHRSKIRPLLALVVSGAIIGAGAVFANVEDKEIAHADDFVANVTSNGVEQSPPLSSSDNSTGTTISSNHNGISKEMTPSSSGSISRPSTPDRIQNPLTSGGGRNHEFGKDDDDRGGSGFRPPRPGHHEERHESGEHEDDDD